MPWFCFQVVRGWVRGLCGGAVVSPGPVSSRAALRPLQFSR